MKKAFASVSKPIFSAALTKRLGVPLAFAQWLVELDSIAGYKIMRTPLAREKWDKTSLLGLQLLVFNPELGTGHPQHIYRACGLRCLLAHTRVYTSVRKPLPSPQTEGWRRVRCLEYLFCGRRPSVLRDDPGSQ